VRLSLALFLALAACSSDPEPQKVGPRVVASGDAAWERGGAQGVGHEVFVATDEKRARTLTIQVWFPAASNPGTALEDVVVDEAQKATLKKLLAAAPDACTRKRIGSMKVAAATGPFPLIAFSHCHGCARFAMGEIAERLASHGFAVVAPDHTGNTLFDNTAPLSGEFLATRAADIEFAIDTVLNTPPSTLSGRFDGNKLGMFGHSYGAATTGLVLARDPRIKAGVAIAAPMENDLLPPAKMAEIKVPTMFLLAREDNSITEIGNKLIRSNFERAVAPIWLQEIDDAGHWSFSDICALTENLRPGCGEGTRQTEAGESFFYLENASARALAASYVTAFFLAHLNGDAGARAFLSAKHPSGVVTTSARP